MTISISAKYLDLEIKTIVYIELHLKSTEGRYNEVAVFCCRT